MTKHIPPGHPRIHQKDGYVEFLVSSESGGLWEDIYALNKCEIDNFRNAMIAYWTELLEAEPYRDTGWGDTQILMKHIHFWRNWRKE